MWWLFPEGEESAERAAEGHYTQVAIWVAGHMISSQPKQKKLDNFLEKKVEKETKLKTL